NRWVAFALVTVAFGLMHSSNPEMHEGFWQVMPAYLMMSALFGWITLRDQGLELALGLHLGNNLLVALVMSTSDGALNTPSLFKTTVGDLMQVLPPLLAVMSLLSLLIIWWRYWKVRSIETGQA
ncbi:MAG: CPBP family glutamic-type intramembrane protease, partial [Bacteroidota bacterium]